jgi:hypothetical protein
VNTNQNIGRQGTLNLIKRIGFLVIFVGFALVPIIGRAANADEFVLTNVLNGRHVDLKQHFSNRLERQVSAETVRRLVMIAETNSIVRHAGIKIGGAVFTNTLRIRYWTIPCELHLTNSVFEGDFLLQGCHFQALFDIHGSEFKNIVRIDECRFDAFFGADDVKFLGAEEVWFHTSSFKHGVELDRAVFGGAGVNFNFVEVKDYFSAKVWTFSNTTANCSFWRTRLAANAHFEDTIFPQNVLFTRAKVDILSFFNCKFIAKPDFTGLQFDEITLRSTNYPRTTLELLRDYSTNGSQTLRAYEKYLLERGLEDEAKDAYLAARRFQRQSASSVMAFLELIFVDWLTGYGKCVERVLIACLVFIAIGTFVFWERRRDWLSPRQMQLANKEQRSIRYNPIWFSLDAFLPGVDLGLYGKWIPKENRGWRLTYLRTHKALGWIFVPLLIAAAAGLFGK